MNQQEMNRVKDLLEHGQVNDAQKILQDILKANLRDLQAWSMYVKSCDTNEKRIKALEQCLKYNPENNDVKRALDTLRNQASAPLQPPPPAQRPIPQQVKVEKQLSNTGGTPPLSTPPAPAQLTKEEIDRQARMLEESRRKQKNISGSQAIMPWYEVWIAAVTKPNVDMYNLLKNNPYALPSRAYIWLVSSGLVSGLSLSLTFMLNPQYTELVGMLDQNGSMGVGQMIGALLFCLVPLSGIMNLIGTAIFTGVLHLIAELFGGDGKYSELFYLVAAYSSPISIATTLLNVIPIVGGCLALPISFYSINLLVQSIRSTYKFDGIRAIGVIVIVAILNLIIFGTIGWVIFSAIAAKLPPMSL